MKTEFLKGLGLTDDQIKSIMAENGKDINEIKAKLDDSNNAKTQLEADLKERDTQLENLKKSAGDNDELKKQIETLQSENRAAKEKYESDLKELQITNAIKLAIADSAQEVDLVAGLFDKSKLILDGDKVTGLEEQLKVMKESRGFLFKPQENNNSNNQQQNNQQQKPGFIFGAPQNNPPKEGERMSMKEAIAAKLQGINN